LEARATRKSRSIRPRHWSRGRGGGAAEARGPQQLHARSSAIALT